MATRDEARDALYAAIVAVATTSEDYSGPTQSEMVRDAAVAFRAVVGGAQPGNTIVGSAATS